MANGRVAWCTISWAWRIIIGKHIYFEIRFSIRNYKPRFLHVILFNCSESEHTIPRRINRKWRETYKFGYEGAAVQKFRKLLREKIYNVKRRSKK